MAKKYSNKLGVAVLESAGIMILVTCGIIAILYFLKNNPSGFPGFSVEDRNYRELIKKNRAEAELVIIGKIINMHAQIQEGMSADGDPLGIKYGFVDFAIESIERGYYPGDKISVYFGWASNLSPPENYPFGTKLDYKVGDRVRAFVSYGTPAATGPGSAQPCYFTALAYLSLEPLKPSREEHK